MSKEKLIHELRVRNNEIARLGKKIDRQEKVEKFLWGYIAVFSLLVVVYFLLEWIK